MNCHVLHQKRVLQSIGYAARLWKNSFQNKLKYPWNEQQHSLLNGAINQRNYSTKEKFDDIYTRTKQKFLCKFEWNMCEHIELFN